VTQKPLVLQDELGSILDVVFMNPKTFAKSTEHAGVWYVHLDADRELPYREGISFILLEDRESYYRGVIDSRVWQAAPADKEELSTSPGPAESGEQSADPQVDPTVDSQWEDVLRSLVSVIADRKVNLPEGSYTTYLFNSGESKIRKKTGEEAVELILAQDRNEITSEAADLIYHLLVLFTELEIPFDEVIRELDKRS
jgi:phosphoribosyl-ATP pyrophosphohydrolase